MPREVQKVACYVVHDGHLLVFTHNDVPITETGVQVPAGSIQPGETSEEAAIRELFEETGRHGHPVRGVGTQEYDLRPARDEIAVRHYFHMNMEDVDLAERWTAGELDPSHGGASINWTCWWMPLTNGHVLAAGFAGLLGVMLDEGTAP
ncbi:NUDIX domain-containing protein [Arthrobacter cheniae]|uniref:NUDIX domain-containing protein n=1 Tax=Arthrobacter cheniae TaxID=1258888 RepID=A0A3A5M6K5_9MICC|nr:NUDIX domain-containing protein [Arthrobacter cheniae]RJT75656.1 NUDIX domain-containing protein [Arthrobacter cheniae]